MAFLDFLFPHYKCMICKRELNSPANIYLCDTCVKELPFNTQPITLLNTDEKQYFDRAYAPFKYEDKISKLILSFKYSADGQVAELFAPFMSAVLKDYENKILVPVPLCAKRHKRRGYNQSLFLARAIAKYLDLPINANILKRVRETTIQKHMSPKERVENLRDAFQITNNTDIKGKSFIIVDDVYTSGSTVNECAKMLKSAGAKSVDVLVIARV